MEPLQIVGANVPKVDGIHKATGEAKFTVDLTLPGMLHAKILRSPYAHAYIKSIDVSDALKVSGVECIITHRDVPKSKYCRALPPGLSTPDEYIINDKARFVGDPVAAVAASTVQAADEAVSVINVEYEELPAVFDPLKAMEADAPRIHDVDRNIASSINWVTGDVKDGFRAAAVVVEDRYKAQPIQHCQLERHCALAMLQTDGRLTVWSSNQAPFLLRNSLANVLGLPVRRVRVIKPHIGGGFGGKIDLITEPICAFLALKTRKPVKLEFTREETFLGTSTRHPTILDLKMGARKDGKLTALEVNGIVDTGAYVSHGGTVLGVLCEGFASVLYKVPASKIQGFTVYTNRPVAGAFRGFGFPKSFHALESHMDRLAEALELDPIEFRLKNAVKEGDPNPVHPAWKITSNALEECLRKGAERIGWNSKRDLRKEGVKRRGVGLGCYTLVSGANPFKPEVSSAIVTVNEDGSITVRTGVVDIGTGATTTMAQIAAEELGVRLEDVIIDPTVDTDSHPFDMGAYADRSTFVGGNAVRAAATEAKQQLLQLASSALKVDQSALDIKNGLVFVKRQEEKSITVAELVSRFQFATEGAKCVIGTASYEPPHNCPDYGVQFAEVEVDTETGEVKVLKVVAAHDIGRAIGPARAEGQLEGAVAQGLGATLTENLILDPETGRVLNPSFADYKIMTSLDMPEVEAILVESNEPDAPFGGKGIGECGLAGLLGALANAVYDAIGVRLTELPITPEKVLRSLESKKS